MSDAMELRPPQAELEGIQAPSRKIDSLLVSQLPGVDTTDDITLVGGLTLGVATLMGFCALPLTDGAGFIPVLSAAIASGLGLSGVLWSRSRKRRNQRQALEQTASVRGEISDRIDSWLSHSYGLSFDSSHSREEAAMDLFLGRLSPNRIWDFRTAEGGTIKGKLALKGSKLELHRAELSSPNQSIYFDPIQELS